MKPKVEKKGKKRPLSEASLSTKPSQKDENVIDLKKNLKRPKLSLQNGKSTTENKVQILKKMYKQNEKQKEKTKQINIGPVRKIKTEGKIKLPYAELNKELTIKEEKTKEKILKNLKEKQEKRNLLKKRRKRSPLERGSNITLSIEEIKAKIEEIRSREVISKRAKRILSVLNRKLQHEKPVTNSEKLNIKKEKNTKNKQQTGILVKTEQVSNENNKGKIKVKKEHNQPKKVLIKQEEIDDDSDDEVMKSVDDEDESDEDQSDTEMEESLDNASEQFDDESDDDDDDDDEEDEEDEEDKEDEEDDDGEEDEDDEDEKVNILKAKQEEDEDDEDDEDEKVNILKVKQEDVKKTKKQATQPLEHQKKNPYVLFVGNLPYSVTADELKQYFLTKVGTVSDIRIPTAPDTKKPRGFAYVELTNSADFEKGLSLNHTFLNKRRINVEPTRSNDNKKNVGKNFAFAKNKKPQAFQKAKQLGSGNQGKKKSMKKEK